MHLISTAIIIAIGMCFAASGASADKANVKFGGLNLFIPVPSGQCVLGSETPAEANLLSWATAGQLAATNKLLIYLTECSVIEALQNGYNIGHKLSYTIIVAQLIGGKEIIFPKATQKQFSKQSSVGLNFSDEMVAEMLGSLTKDGIAQKHGIPESYLKKREATSFVVLDNSDALYFARISKTLQKSSDNQPIWLANLGAARLINGIPLYLFSYSPFEDDSTITTKLSVMKSLVAAIIEENP